MDGPLVMIDWIDSYGCSTDWRELEALKKDQPMVCKSVGWLLAGDINNAQFVTIVPHVTPGDHERANQQGCGDMTIPRRAITSMIRLDEGPVIVPPAT